MKRILSMFLALCMVVTLLPVSAMAEGIHTTIGTSGEIISFAPLAETEKTRALGTSIQGLELPETLTATVRTAVSIGEDSVQDSGSPETATPTTATEPEWEETTMDIPVKWESTPEYDMDTEGEYVFTPVITGYTVKAELPEIKVTVETTVMGDWLAGTLSATTYDIWVGGIQVTEENKGDVFEDGGTVTYDPIENTLTLNGAEITNVYEKEESGKNKQYGIYATIPNLKLSVTGTNTITCPNASEKYSYGIYTTGTLEISESGSGSLTSDTGSCGVNAGIYSVGSLTISSGTITAISRTDAPASSLGICSQAKLTITGGNVTGQSTGYSSTGIGASSFEITGGKVTATGGTGLAASYQINISGGEVIAIGNGDGSSTSTESWYRGMSGALNITGGVVTVTSDRQALVGTLTVTGGTAMASTDKGGSDAVAYDAANLENYKYLKFEPAAGVSEQFDLTPGGTYYNNQLRTKSLLK